MFCQFLLLFVEKISFLKILCYGTYVVGFQTRVILDLWGMTFHAMVVIALILALLLESISAYCGNIQATLFLHFDDNILCFSFLRFVNLQIILNSMHKFQPRIHLVMVSDEWNASHGIDLTGGMKHKTFIFDLTAFTAVTAYQNQLVSII